MAEDKYPYFKIPEEYYYEFYSKRSEATVEKAKYANVSFFKKKDEEAIKFLKKHPIPADFWKV